MSLRALSTLIAGCLATLPLVGCGGDGGGACDAEALQEQLAEASGGDRVELGRCRVEASLEVPDGVTLAGVDRQESVLAAPEGEVAVRLGAGSRLEGLTVAARGTVGVYAQGGTPVSLRSVTVTGERGAAVLADDVAELALTDVRLEGPVTAELAQDSAYLEPDPATMPTHGLVLLGVGDAQLTDVSVTGFAHYGAVVQDASSAGESRPTSLRWNGGEVGDNLGYGIYLQGATTEATLEGIAVRNTLQGLRIMPPYGVLAVDGARVESSDLLVADNDRYGLLHLGAPALHQNLVATDNGDAAVWVGESDDFELAGEATDVHGNAFAGLVVVGSTNVRLRDGNVSRTATSRRNIGSGDVFGMVEVGDGVHLLGSRSDILLEALTLEDNGRTGLLVDLGSDDGAGITFRDVVVDGTGEQLGAIAGTTDDPDAPSELTPAGVGDWDTGIERQGAAIDNDPAFSERLDVAGAISPSSFPAPEDVAGAISPSS